MEMIVLSLPACGNNASGIEPGNRLMIRCPHLCGRINYVGFVGTLHIKQQTELAINRWLPEGARGKSKDGD